MVSIGIKSNCNLPVLIFKFSNSKRVKITDKQRLVILQWLYGGGYVLLIAAVLFYFGLWPKLAPYIFSLGVMFLIVPRVILPIEATNVQTKRLNKIHAFATLVLVASAYGMFIHHYLWIAGLLCSTLIDLYVSFRLPKPKKETDQN
jgi:hypothetical protein